jgi:HTH-type transcriptional regulator/antitoxin MqsA
MTNLRKCPICGGTSKPLIEAREVKVGRWTATVDDEFMRCDSCGDEAYLPGQMQATQERAARVVRDREKLVSPERVRAIREKYGLTQSQLERLLGVGAKTVVRWERGTVMPSAAINTLLKVVDNTPTVVAGLAVENGVILTERLQPSAITVQVYLAGTMTWGTFAWRSPPEPASIAPQPGDPLPAAIELRMRNKHIPIIDLEDLKETLA